MQAAAPLIGAGVSALGGLFGGNKAKQEQNSTSTSSTNQTQTQEQQSLARNEYDENPIVAAARNGMLANLLSQYNKAQNPVYGTNEIGSFLNTNNETTNDALSKLNNFMAGSGAGRSGRAAGGASSILRGGASNAAGFMSALPMQNENARRTASNALLQLAGQWLGAGPVNVTQTGNSSATGTTSGTTTQTGNATSTGNSGGGVNGLLSGLAGFGGGLLGDVVAGKGKGWGINWKP